MWGRTMGYLWSYLTGSIIGGNRELLDTSVTQILLGLDRGVLLGLLIFLENYTILLNL